MLKQLFLFAILLVIASASYTRINVYAAVDKTSSMYNEVLYLPNGNSLDLISFGYKNVLAHTLWFNTINYFGKHYKSDRNYKWLGHMCNLITELNPAMSEVYEFCSLMLTWEANSPQQSIELLNKAHDALPDNWKFPYLRGINYLLFVKDEDRAKADFILAAGLPDAHPYVARLAAKKISISENKETAIEFLEGMIKNSKQEWEKNSLIQKLNEIKSSITEKEQDAVQE